MLVTLNYAFSTTNLVIRDSVGYILDESVQHSGVILVPQEFQQFVLFGKRLEFHNDAHQPPTNTPRKQDGSECGDSGAHKPAKQFPPCTLQVITFPWRRAEYTRERQYPLFYFFNLPSITHGSLVHGPSAQQFDSCWNGTHIVVLN